MRGDARAVTLRIADERIVKSGHQCLHLFGRPVGLARKGLPQLIARSHKRVPSLLHG